MKLSTTRQIWYVLYLFARGYIATGVANRLGMKKQFENFYFERLKTVDPVTFDKAYFSDVSAMVKDTREKYDRLSKWNILTLALLILCVLGGLDTFSYYGTSLKIRDFSALILLVYSTTKLQLMNLNLSIVTRESLLRAHALSVASEVDCDLYRLRYALLDTPSIEDIYRPGLPGAPVITRKPVRATVAADFVLLFFGGYFLFYFVVAIYALFLPGLNPVFRLVAVSFSIVCELVSTLGGIFLEYGATKDSNAIRKYVQNFMTRMNKPPNTTS